MNILVLNAGSSSVKFHLYHLDSLIPLTEPETILATGEIERIGTPEARLQMKVGQGEEQSKPLNAASVEEAVEQVLRALLAPETNGGQPFAIDVMGHRIVHGGPHFVQPVRVNDTVLKELRDLTELDPLHTPGGVAGIESGMRLLPDAPAVAVFDTAFHHDLPPTAAQYALPRDLSQQHHLRRYGFHGISYQYVTQRLLLAMGREANGTRLVICHLGSGASVCAVRDGKSVDTSMGFTPLEGLIMGTRSGDIDPGLVLYLIHALNMSSEEVDDLLNKKSGLLGLSGRSDDTRDLEEAAQGGDAHSAEALEAFAYRVRKYVGAYVAILGGVDALAFTAGIGQHAYLLRARICRGLDFMRLDLDAERNHKATGDDPSAIGTGDGQRVWVVPTDEDRQIARETFALLNG